MRENGQVDRAEIEAYASRVRGCLLGGAVGDALGAPVEFQSLPDIRAEHGPDGVRAYLRGTGAGPAYGAVTDDTQLTLFTAEGLIRAGVRTDRGLGFTVAVVHSAYDRWLDTQTLAGPPAHPSGWLAAESWLYSRRAPGNTCLSALGGARDGGDRIRQYGGQVGNDSKGCGAVMRSAPFGLLPRAWAPVATVFDWAEEAAGYTHGHPSGKLSAGALAAIVAGLVDGADVPAAVGAALGLLRRKPESGETVAALAAAVAAAQAGPPDAAAVERLGAGWVGEEALAIAVYAALAYPEPEGFLDALALAVTHSGDSDSTGAICGNILGARHGEWAVPPELAFEVEGRGAILELADDFVYEFTHLNRYLHGDYGPYTRWTARYPGG
jgi:ADP-ribosylglycohydrolase